MLKDILMFLLIVWVARIAWLVITVDTDFDFFNEED